MGEDADSQRETVGSTSLMASVVWMVRKNDSERVEARYIVGRLGRSATTAVGEERSTE